MQQLNTEKRCLRRRDEHPTLRYPRCILLHQALTDWHRLRFGGARAGVCGGGTPQQNLRLTTSMHITLVVRRPGCRNKEFSPKVPHPSFLKRPVAVYFISNGCHDRTGRADYSTENEVFDVDTSILPARYPLLHKCHGRGPPTMQKESMPAKSPSHRSAQEHYVWINKFC